MRTSIAIITLALLVGAAAQHTPTLTKPVPIESRPLARTPLVLLRVEEGVHQPDIIHLQGTSWWEDIEGAYHVVTNGKPPRIPITRYVLGIVTNGVELELMEVAKPR